MYRETNLRIPTDPFSGSRMWGRNGSVLIKGLHLETVASEVWVQGISRQDKDLHNAGLRLQPSELDDLACKWLLNQRLINVREYEALSQRIKLAHTWLDQRVRIISGLGQYFGQSGTIVDITEKDLYGNQLWIRLDETITKEALGCKPAQLEILP